MLSHIKTTFYNTFYTIRNMVPLKQNCEYMGMFLKNTCMVCMLSNDTLVQMY